MTYIKFTNLNRFKKILSFDIKSHFKYEHLYNLFKLYKRLITKL